MFFHKIGGIFVNSTDNLIISKFIGIGTVGLFSNYELVLSALSKIIYQIFEAVTASIGNMGVTETTEKSEKIFYVLLFVNSWIFGVTSICLWSLFNSFIHLSFGQDMLLDQDVVGVIVVKYLSLIHIYKYQNRGKGQRQCNHHQRYRYWGQIH